MYYPAYTFGNCVASDAITMIKQPFVWKTAKTKPGFFGQTVIFKVFKVLPSNS